MKTYLKHIISNYLFRDKIFWKIRTIEKNICFTFDDGPHPIFTPKILDVLDELGAKATFFVIGKNVEKNIDLTKEIIIRGHEIGSHTYSHVSMMDVSHHKYIDDIKKCDELLSVLGVNVKLFRPPFGDIKWRLLPNLIPKRQIILWNKDTLDYSFNNIADAWGHVSRLQLKPGDIILMHDIYDHTVDLVRKLGNKLRESAWNIQTITNLLK